MTINEPAGTAHYNTRATLKLTYMLGIEVLQVHSSGLEKAPLPLPLKCAVHIKVSISLCMHTDKTTYMRQV